MKKIALLCLALVLALGALGVGYSMWDKTLTINGTVNTGEVNACFTTAVSNDPGTTIDPGKDKHVGSTEVFCNDPGEEGNPFHACQQNILVVVTNGYPCYESTVNFTVDNIGTIPVKVQSMTITNPNPEITVTWTGPAIGTQIEPGQHAPGDIHVHVEQSAAELTPYTFSAEIYLVQWNEYTP